MKNKRILKERGITLIALAVTIVVLLILAGVSLNAVFGQDGIIQKAKDSQNKMDEATQNDLDSINELNNWIDGKTNGTTGGNTGKDDDKPFGGEKYNKAEKNNDGTLKANTEYTDSENATVTIPKEFKVSDVAKTEDIDGEQTVSTGLVIQDANGNEFVWVPVNYTATGTLDDDGLDSGFKDTFKRSRASSSSTEPYASGYGENGAEEKSDYLKMMKSVQKNKGFYIGRYEVGTTTPRTSATKETSSDIVVKRDAYPYIYVGWGNAMNDITTDVTYANQLRGKGAVYLSKHMYDKKDIGATSTLCYGVQWDAAMRFVADSTHSTSNSTNWGNYKNNAWNITRTTAKYEQTGSWTDITSNKEKTSSESFLLTTGASDSFKAKNIFDLAGNVYEWTMEANFSTSRVYRGGHYGNNGSDRPASDRGSNNLTYSLYCLGFRSALYL